MKPRPAPKPLQILDSIGFDLRLAPLPLVKEHATLAPYIEAGGWINTVPASLGEPITREPTA